MLNILRSTVIIVVGIFLLVASVGLLIKVSGSAAPPMKGQKVVGRKVFSPVVRHDPYVLQQWETSVRALEEECRHTRRHCVEAKKAREAMDELNGTSRR